MDKKTKKKTKKIFDDVNRAIIKFRGTYSEWSGRNQISYHEMLVLYTIREFGFCTQKQICDSYLLPKQTIHNVIASLRQAGILEYDEALYNIIDSLFIGRYSDSGLTALSIIYPLQLLMIALAVGTGVGINTAMAAIVAKKGFRRPPAKEQYSFRQEEEERIGKKE